MRYEPSHRKLPPRQAPWPYATPQEGWPAYLPGDGDWDGDRARELQGADRRGWEAAGDRVQPGYEHPADGYGAPGRYGAADGYGAPGRYGAADGYGDPGRYGDAGDGYASPGNGSGGGHAEMAGDYAAGRASHPWNGQDRYGGAQSGYGDAWNDSQDAWNGNGSARDGYADSWNGYGDTSVGYGDTSVGYADSWNGYGDTRDGYGAYEGYSETRDAFSGSAGFRAQLDRDEYAEPRPSGPMLIAPDTIGEPGWLQDESEALARHRDRGDLIVGAVMGFLAAAVAIGFATLAAAFVRPQASPVIAVGGAFIDRTPPALKNFAVEHFGENDKTVLLLGMYVTIALIAVAVGCLARRNGVTIGVAGLAAFGLFGAFVAITRPESHPTDVIPSVVGGIAGVIALLWLDRRATPLSPSQPARGGGRRRAR